MLKKREGFKADRQYSPRKSGGKAACATKYRKNRPERGKELLFVEINFGAKARDSFKAIMTAYYDSYGTVSKQRAEYVYSKMRTLLEIIYATIEEKS